MLLTRTHALALCLSLALGTFGAFGACSGGGSPGGPSAGAPGAGATADAGSGGVGAGSGGSGAGAAAGAGTGAGAAGAATATWAALGSVNTCAVERLTNAKDAPSFVWAACAGNADPACEEAMLSPLAGLRNAKDAISGGIHDDGQAVRVHIKERDDSIVAFADEAGATLEAFRTKTPKTCALWTGSLWAERYGVAAGTYDVGIADGGVVGRFGDSPVVFQLDPPFGGGPQAFEMGTSRWAWWWQPQGMVSVSAIDGLGFTQFSFAKATTGPVYAASGLATSGDLFFSVEFVLKGDHAAPRIVVSDGIAPAKELFAPTADGEDNTPLFADSHIAWFRGYGRKDLNVYDKVEIWASSWSTSGTLSPYKVADYYGTWNGWHPLALRGGWGRVAMIAGGEQAPDGTTAPVSLLIVDLKTHATKTISLPPGLGINRVMGVARSHVWAIAGSVKPGLGQRILRWKL